MYVYVIQVCAHLLPLFRIGVHTKAAKVSSREWICMCMYMHPNLRARACVGR